MTCPSCGGRGGRWAHRHRPAGFDALSSAPLSGRMEWARCFPCDGLGRVACDDCGLGPGADAGPLDPDATDADGAADD